MKPYRIISLVFVLALIVATPVFTAPGDKPKPKPDLPKPEFDIKNATVVVDRWEAVFAEGQKVGWKHLTISRFNVLTVSHYLFEEVYEAKFGIEKISITRRAQTNTDGMLEAFSFLSETNQYKVENYAVPVGEGREAFIKHTVFDNTAGKYVETVTKTDALPRAFPKFAIADIIILNYVQSRKMSSTLVAYDLCEMRREFFSSEYKKEREIKFGDKPQTLSEIIILGNKGVSETKYYFEDYKDKERPNEIKYSRNTHMPIATQTMEKAKARSKTGKDADFVADEYLQKNAYKDTKRGVVFTRPSEAWVLKRIDVTDNTTAIRLTDMVGMQTAYCVTVTHIPAGLQPDQIEACMRRLMSNLMQNLFEIPAPGESKNFGSLDLYAKTGKMSEDVNIRYFCLVGNNRAVGIILASPAYLIEAQKAQTKVFLESFVLSKILLPSPPKTSFLFTGGFVSAKGYHPSWTLRETPTGMDVGNDILGITCKITGGKQPETLPNRIQIALKNVSGIPRPKTEDVKLHSKVGTISAIEMLSYSRKKDENKVSLTCYKTYVLLGVRGDKYMYRATFTIPMDVRAVAFAQITDLLGTMNFKMN